MAESIKYIPDVGEPLEPDEYAPLLSVMLFPDETSVLACTTSDFFVWDIESAVCSYQHDISYMRLFPDVPLRLTNGPDRSFISSYGKGEFALWSLDSFKRIHIFSGHTEHVYDACFLDSQHAVSCSADSSLRRWDRSGQCLDHAWVHSGPRRIADSSDRGQLAIAGDNGIDVVRRDSLEVTAFYDLAFEDTAYNADWPEWSRLTIVKGLAWCPDADHVIAAGSDAVVRRIDSRSGRIEGKWLGHRASINDLLLLPGGTGFVTVSDDKTVKFWSFAADECVATHELPDTVPGHCVASNGRVFAACADGFVYAIEPPPSLLRGRS